MRVLEHVEANSKARIEVDKLNITLQGESPQIHCSGFNNPRVTEMVPISLSMPNGKGVPMIIYLDSDRAAYCGTKGL